MFINKTGEYALRCMVIIYQNSQSGLLKSDAICEETNIPKEYLSKILKQLTKKKLLLSEKGHFGGYKLAKEPSKISLLSILNAVGCEFDENHCAFGWNRCDSKNPCPLHNCFSKINNDIHSWAKENTLSAILVKNHKFTS